MLGFVVGQFGNPVRKVKPRIKRYLRKVLRSLLKRGNVSKCVRRLLIGYHWYKRQRVRAGRCLY